MGVSINKKTRRIFCVAAVAGMLALGAGCEDDGKAGNGGNAGGAETEKIIPATDGGEGKKGARVSDIEVGNLCSYESNVSMRAGDGSRYKGLVLFQNEAELTSFLNFTGYFENEQLEWMITQKIAHQPDFKKWVYFAIENMDWRAFQVDVSDGDTVTINYTPLYPPGGCDGSVHPPDLYAPPPAAAAVYFIPFTEKPVVLVTHKENIKCGYDNCPGNK